MQSILRCDMMTLNKWFSDSKEICEHLTLSGGHRLSYIHFPMENSDQKRLAKDETPKKGCMAGHLFGYTSNKDIIMREYLCDCEECLSLNFVSSVKNTSKFIENKNDD